MNTRKNNTPSEECYLLMRFGLGIKRMFSNIKSAIVVAAFIAAAAVTWSKRVDILEKLTSNIVFTYKGLVLDLLEIALGFLLIGGLFMVIVMVGTPIIAWRVQSALRRIGLVNHAGEAPILIKQRKGKNKTIVMEFEANGLHRSKWEDVLPAIEVILNRNVVKVVEGRSKRRIYLHTVKAKNSLPEKIYWKEDFLSVENFELVLGESLLGQAMVNISKIPHILIGGSSGSGKSVLLKSLLLQAAKKGAKLYIVDLKGGVDFSPSWYMWSRLLYTDEELKPTLRELVDLLEMRKALLRESNCANIDEYNRKMTSPMDRIIFACDEVAELLDKTGRDKEGKERIAEYESMLSTIARQGRAFGIHLILSTQRPDANIISGQIKNNMDCRICGRADKILSQIILDNSYANDLIPKEGQGRFLTEDGTVFQGYLFDEEEALKNWRDKRR